MLLGDWPEGHSLFLAGRCRFFAADRKGKANLSAGRQILPEIQMIQKQSAVDRKDEENISL